MKKVAIMYRDGQGTAKDEGASFYWFLKLAELGNVEGQVGVGNCYLYARGTDKDEYKAVYYFTLASKQGNSIGICNLGYCFEYGLGGLPKDGWAFALCLYREACKKEYSLGCSNQKKLDDWLMEKGYLITIGSLKLNDCIIKAENSMD